ncbi:MAG TPA: MBOAT family O-acyltransferase [Chitinophagaceae bacterium]|nr:MBOAT family O-acyltransferase [Chitinophagaceae bacterium]
MLFNSLEFILFFIVVTAVYFFLPHRYRWFHLLAASCYFYMAFVPVYILILGGTIVVDYFAGLWIEKTEGTNRKLLLILSLAANIGVLAVFKYYNFFVENINELGFRFSFLKILLPIGLSFHTFQAMSYTIEVYRGNQKAEKHFGIYALYVMFYPQLVAGPIERPQHMLHQFYEKHEFDADEFFIGFKMMLWGMFKKVVIADRLAIMVNTVYSYPQNYNSTMLLLATVFFSVQIYCDFSGYSSIAIGAAKVMGFKLMTNFNKPYEARSIDEFWKRWHISLSTWFRDYLYIPLGGNRVRIPRWYLNLFIVFIISGLWHGANWTFIIWGALHGFYLVLSIITKNARTQLDKLLHFEKGSRLHTFLQVAITFSLVTLAWIFFRSESVNDSFYIIKKIFSNNWGPLQEHITFSKFSYILSILLIAFLFIAENRIVDKIIFLKLSEQYKRSVAFGVIIMMMILVLGIFQNLAFIYFQF